VKVAIVHDYLTQRGGAERVVLSMLKAFPGAPVYTSLYDPRGTFAEFAAVDVRTLFLDRIPALRRNHRLALPLLAAAFSRLEVSADVVLCSTSGWAHGARVRGAKIVYCYAPARWLYQTDRYLGGARPLARAAVKALAPYLKRWDRQAALSADRYLTQCTAVRERIRAAYGIDAVTLPPPPALETSGAQQAVAGLASGFFLCVARLLPYKNVGAIAEAFAALPGNRLVVVGTGPLQQGLRARAPSNVSFLGGVTDGELRWLYANATGLIAASYEDFGLTPLEAAAFGKPAAVLRDGGFLDTVVEGTTGVFFDRPEPAAIRDAVKHVRAQSWNAGVLQTHAGRYSELKFVERLRNIVAH
jgi:glycosyltransferase involved in cell wall biosynthesis